MKEINWCIEQHRKTNHFYDKYLPYEFHLRMVVQVCEDFSHLLERLHSDIELACWGHDLIEDCRVSYNDVKSNLGVTAADIVYAVTNEKGKNRAERGNERYYTGIRDTEGARFVKLCDRIANVQYSRMTKSKMFDMYRNENEKFVGRLYDPSLKEMFQYIDGLFA